MYVAPRLYVRPTFADFAANRDPVLDAVLAYRGEVLAPEVQALVARGDTVLAEQRVRAFAAASINRYVGATAALNSLGYRLLNDGRVEDALRVFRLNVRVHPQYANGWDSLGEGYERAGRVEEAIAAFERVLQLEPHNPRARELLQRLKARR
jgi:Flp pilus assembly protein TadD